MPAISPLAVSENLQALIIRHSLTIPPGHILHPYVSPSKHSQIEDGPIIKTISFDPLIQHFADQDLAIPSSSSSEYPVLYIFGWEEV